ncbi:diaminopropionate ammonia-lyase [Acetobacter malorum]|uniref:diaminopropionate ammonia-lyase n=1 Tax=Acetobacter malorum TaxID=178901 RepID=UPI0039E79D1C
MITDLYAPPAQKPGQSGTTFSFPAGVVAVKDSFDIISAWPGYGVTPLLRLTGAARQFGVGEIFYKQEAARFGLNSFKALGGAYAVCRVLMQVIAQKIGEIPSVTDVLGGRYKDLTASTVVCCATDGNHGRSVAWGAKQLGCHSVVYIHETVSENRGKAIAAYGANVIRTKGNYDDAVHYAEQEAKQNGWTVVSDTSYEGYTEIPGWIMQGYGVIAAEAVQQLGNDKPTHVFVQAGVGGFAAATLSYLRDFYGADAPRGVVVEPSAAACILKSAKAGRYETVTGDLDTIMAGLACGEPSPIALSALFILADAFVATDDDDVRDSMRGLAKGYNGDAAVTAGESGVAGFAALRAIMIEKSDAAARLREILALGPDSRILVIGTEGNTDPDLYREIVFGKDHV